MLVMNPIHLQTLLTIVDEGSFDAIDTFVLHRSTNFGIDKTKFLGDGVVR